MYVEKIKTQGLQSHLDILIPLSLWSWSTWSDIFAIICIFYKFTSKTIANHKIEKPGIIIQIVICTFTINPWKLCEGCFWNQFPCPFAIHHRIPKFSQWLHKVASQIYCFLPVCWGSNMGFPFQNMLVWSNRIYINHWSSAADISYLQNHESTVINCQWLS